jgi:hypothetical protein
MVCTKGGIKKISKVFGEVCNLHRASKQGEKLMTAQENMWQEIAHILQGIKQKLGELRKVTTAKAKASLLNRMWGAIRGKPKELLEKDESLRRMISDLETFSEETKTKSLKTSQLALMLVKEPMPEVKVLTIEDGQNLRNDAALLYHALNISQANLEHWICLSAPRASLQQNRSRSRSRSQVLPSNNFELVVSDRGQRQAITAVPVRFTNSVKPHYSILTVMDALAGSSVTTEVDLLHRGTNFDTGFVVRKSINRDLCRVTEAWLSSYRGVAYPRGLSLQDRIAIICSLIHGCYRCFGSPWLRYLDVQNLVGEARGDGTWLLMLKNSAPNTSIDRVLDEVLRHRPNLANRRQIFRMGLVLTDLALQTQIEQIVYTRDHGTIEIVIPEYAKWPLSAVHIRGLVQQVLAHPTLAKIVYRCLLAFQNWDDGVDQLYHDELYLQ